MDSRGSSWNATGSVAWTGDIDDQPLTRLGGDVSLGTTTTQAVRRRSRALAGLENLNRSARIPFADVLAADQKAS
jgi:hypothetical protein